MSELIAGDLITVIGNQQGGIGSRRYQINVRALREGASGDTGEELTLMGNASPLPVTSPRKIHDADVTRTNRNRQPDPSLHNEPSQTLDWAYLSQLEAAERVVVVEIVSGLDATLHQNVIDELAGALRAKAIKTQWPGWLRGLVQRARTGAFVAHHALAIQRDRQCAAQGVADAEKRRIEADRRNDPAIRARGLKAMAAAIAELAVIAR